MTLGEKLKALREARGWSQRELAQRAHVRQALISELESETRKDTRGLTLQRLARALMVSVDYLLSTYNGPQDPEECPAGEPSLDSDTLPLVPLTP